MNEGISRHARERAGAPRTRAAHRGRPDRHALWALLLSLSLMVLAVATADASSGGISRDDGTAEPGAGEVAFGTRVLRVGMEGSDVKVLNGIITSKPYAARVRISERFEGPTAAAVREFQRRRELAPTGVVNRVTATTLTRSMRRTGATWYGPGFYGNQTACGRTLRRGTIGVAHRTLPCGTKVTFAYRGRHLVVPVIDRGPYTGGYDFDLTSGAARALALDYSDEIRYAVAR